MSVPGDHEKGPGQGFAQYDGRLNRLMPMDDPGLPSLSSKQRRYDFRYGNTLFVGLTNSADVVADVAILSCAQRVHEAVHGSEGDAGDELRELEARMHSLFEAQFGASFEDVTGYETADGH